jgi:Icc-related predicted phosphoesterase
MSRNMRLVAVADTHMFQKDLGAIPDGDVFVHAGDLLRAGTLDELESVASWVRSLPHRHKIVIAGNHDGCFSSNPRAARELLGEAIYLEDSGVILDGLRIWGSPWQPAYNDWAFNLPRGAALAEKWANIPWGTDILVTHGPPAGVGDRGPVAGRGGCEDLLTRVRALKPRLHLFGHIHQDGGFWRHGSTCFANVTTWECERSPTVVDIDLVSGEITEISVPAAVKPRR